MNASLSWHDLSVQHGREVTLHYPDATLQSGEALALTGPSGTGKTTLLHVLAGLLRPASGEVRFAERAISSLSEGGRDAYRRRDVGYVFQDFHLLPGLTALENVQLGLKVAGVADSARLARESLKRLDLGPRLHHRPEQLSTGERQRVAIARAVAHQPKVLLVDEPTAHLDRVRAESVLTLLLELTGELGAATLVVTHDPLVVQAIPNTLHLGGHA